MAGGQERILRGRIRSVQATKKITRAMELIAASRIVKAQQRVAAAVPYSERITEVVKDLAAGGSGLDSPFLKQRDAVRTTCYVAITADRGLCGGCALHASRLGQAFFQQHDGAQHNAQGSEKSTDHGFHSGLKF